MTAVSTDTFDYSDGPLPSPWLPWAGSSPNVLSGAVTVDPFAYGDATRPESVGPDAYCEVIFRTPLDAGPGEQAGLGVRLTSHTSGSNGYMLQADGGSLQLLKDFATPLGASASTSNVDGLRLVAHGDTIQAYALTGGVWRLQLTETDSDYPDVGYTGFWLLDGGTPPVVESFSWGESVPVPAAAARFFARLEPVAYDDANQGGVLQAIATALMAPREVFGVARADEDHEHPWGALLDPDSCPVELLPWLAIFAGTTLPASALSESEKRHRIKAASGMYRATPRATVEELQLVLTGTKTVYIGFHTPDEWHYTVGTLAAETPDTAAGERAVQAQKPAGMVADYVTSDTWIWLFLAPTVIGARAMVDGVDSYVLSAPEYATWQDVIDAFSDWQHVIDNDPDL